MRKFSFIYSVITSIKI